MICQHKGSPGSGHTFVETTLRLNLMAEQRIFTCDGNQFYYNFEIVLLTARVVSQFSIPLCFSVLLFIVWQDCTVKIQLIMFARMLMDRLLLCSRRLWSDSSFLMNSKWLSAHLPRKFLNIELDYRHIYSMTIFSFIGCDNGYLHTPPGMMHRNPSLLRYGELFIGVRSGLAWGYYPDGHHISVRRWASKNPIVSLMSSHLT